MNRAFFLLLALVSTASAQVQLVPDNRVSVRTNNMIYLTNTVLQGDMAIIDTNLVRLYAADVTLSNRITSVSNMVVMASNRAGEAYTLALAATNIPSANSNQQTYVYSMSETATLVSGTAGQTTFTVRAQDLPRMHVGQLLGPASVFAGATSRVSAVDRTSGSNLITITGGGSVYVTTNQTSITMTNAGSLTHTVPDGYSRCRVLVTSAGGGFGHTDAAPDTAAQGGSGATGIGYYQLTPTNTYTVTMGAAGIGDGAAGEVGTDGGSSSFGSLITATGGGGGDGTGGSPVGGIGGTASGGAMQLSGGTGVRGYETMADLPTVPSFWGCSYGAGGGPPSLPAGRGVVVVEYY